MSLYEYIMNSYQTNSQAQPNSTEDMMDFPTSVYPWSGTHSGLPEEYQTQFMDALMPEVTSYLDNPTDFQNNYFQQASSGYINQLNNALNQVLPQQINSLANRGILSSSDANQTLADAMSRTSTAIMTPLLSASANAANAYSSNLTDMLNASRINTSYSEDRTQMYQIIAALLQGTQ